MRTFEKKKCILIGDYSNPPYHPLTNVDGELINIFNELLELTCTENYNLLLPESLEKFDLCVLYVDSFGKEVDEELIKSLLNFIKAGKGLLVIHNGISFQSNNEFTELIGAKFTGHPSYTNLQIKATIPRHPIMDGISDFTIDDEPYRYDIGSLKEEEIIFKYIHEGNTYPGAWTRCFGEGKIVYLMPGHDLNSFRSDCYRKVILKSAMWVLDLI